MMVNRFNFVFLIFVYMSVAPALCLGDLNVVKEVVIAPKGVKAAANIDSVNSSANVRLDTATVDIHVGRPGKGPLAPLPLNVKATFTLINESSHEMKLRIDFPISNSQSASFKPVHFTVVTDGAAREVEGNHQGIWPQEVNNVPAQLLQKSTSRQYYFFDYYLTSGASWAGSIAFEDVTLHFDYWWRDLEFYSTIERGVIGWSKRILYSDLPIVATYQLRNEEPTENIYFAIRPGKNTKPGESRYGNTSGEMPVD